MIEQFLHQILTSHALDTEPYAFYVRKNFLGKKSTMILRSALVRETWAPNFIRVSTIVGNSNYIQRQDKQLQVVKTFPGKRNKSFKK